MEFAGIGLALVAACAAAISALSIRLGTTKGKADDAIIVVLLSNLVIFVIIALVTTPPSYRPTSQAVLAFIGAGLIGTMVGRALYFHGIEQVGASRADTIKASTPLHATILAVLILGETLTRGHIFGIVAIVVGVGLISLESSRQPGIGGKNVPLLALGLPLAAAVAFGIEPIFAKIGFAEDTPLFVALSIKTIASSLGFLVYLWWKNALPNIPAIPRKTLHWYLLAGLVNSLFHIAYYLALTIAPVVLVVPIVQMSPLLVAILGFFYLQHLEKITPKLILGACIVVLGGIFVSIHG